MPAARPHCPSDAGAEPLDTLMQHAVLELARQEAAAAGELPGAHPVNLEVEVLATRPAFDGFPPQWQQQGVSHRRCLQLRQDGTARGCEAGKAAEAAVQLHVDCDGDRRSLLFVRPTPVSKLLSVENPVIVLSDFDVWLDVRAAGGDLELVGGCFPGWGPSLQGRLGLRGAAHVPGFCSPLYVPNGAGGYAPWSVVRPRRERR